MRSLILIGLLFVTGLLSAQSNYKPGFIINITGDTIYGEIDYRGDYLMSSICKFKDKGNNIREYHPNDLSAYRFIDGKYFESKEVKGKTFFLEYLIKGKINIYCMRDEKGDHYFLDKEGVGLTEITYEKELKYIDGKLALYESKQHIGTLIYYTKDAPEFQSRIYSLKEPGYHDLIKLAEDYHHVVCKDEECIIYEKKLPFLKINLEVVSGVVNFEKEDLIFETEDLTLDKFYFQNGVIAHFWMPRTNEKIYFKTGILYSRPEKGGDRKSNIRVPAHIGYLASDAFFIRPSVSIGLLSPSYSAGVLFRINEKTNIGVQSCVNFDFDKVIWIPWKMKNYSLLASMYFEL